MAIFAYTRYKINFKCFKEEKVVQAQQNTNKRTQKKLACQVGWKVIMRLLAHFIHRLCKFVYIVTRQLVKVAFKLSDAQSGATNLSSNHIVYFVFHVIVWVNITWVSFDTMRRLLFIDIEIGWMWTFGHPIYLESFPSDDWVSGEETNDFDCIIFYRMQVEGEDKSRLWLRLLVSRVFWHWIKLSRTRTWESVTRLPSILTAPRFVSETCQNGQRIRWFFNWFSVQLCHSISTWWDQRATGHCILQRFHPETTSSQWFLSWLPVSLVSPDNCWSSGPANFQWNVSTDEVCRNLLHSHDTRRFK